MTLFYIIGGLAVIAGITAMTILYYKTAAELERTRSELRRAKRFIRKFNTPIDYEIDEGTVQDIKFGEF